MITAILVFVLIAIFVAFGSGYALGYNTAKHPEKVDAQLQKAEDKVKNLFPVLALAAILGLTYADARASEPINTAGPLDCSTGICTQRLTRETVPKGTKQFHWTTLTQLFNKSDDGENVASYAQAYKQGFAPTWALVGEERCVHQRGGCHGAEIDLVVDGPLQDGDWRLGQSIVIWKMPGSTGTPEANYALLIAPQWQERESIRVDYGVSVQTHCYFACLQVRTGEKIALSDDASIAVRYNPMTARIEFLNGERVVFSIPTN